MSARGASAIRTKPIGAIKPGALDLLLGWRAKEAARASMGVRQPWEAVIPLDELAGVPVLLVQGDWCPAPLSARARAGAAFRAVCDVLHDRLDARRAVFPASHNAQRLGKVFNNQLQAFWEAV